MAMLSVSHWLASLTPEQRSDRGFPPHMLDPKTGSGRKKVYNPDLAAALVRWVEDRKRAIDWDAENVAGVTRRQRRRRDYGYACTDTKAIAWIALDEYRRRLIGEGESPDEADRRVEAHARSLVFEDQIMVIRTKLSDLRP